MQCQKCHSENTQALSVVYAQGTKHVSAGVSGLGRSRTKTEGTSISAMAQRAAPPKKREISVTIVIVCISMLLFVNMHGIQAKVLWGVCIGVCVWYLVRAISYNKNEFPGQWRRWNESWICNKCGTIYHQPLNR